jgi:two-component system, LytTR family, response regulator
MSNESCIEPDGRANVKSFLHQYFPEIEVSGEAASVAEALKVLSRNKIDLLFLDIELQDGTGFDLLDRLQNVSFNVIFTTAHNDFAIRAFRYNALDY